MKTSTASGLFFTKAAFVTRGGASNDGIDIFAVVSATASLVLLKKYYFPIHCLVPIGAAAGVIRKILI